MRLIPPDRSWNAVAASRRSKPRSTDFRKDINGLRAWAVAAVIGYHFQLPGFGGGFIGVDVFFVISGFLMTRIIAGGLETSDFSLLAFYWSRARRIVPALLGLCFVLLAVGWFTLLSTDFKQLAEHSVSALLFYSNFKFADEAGYFDAASHEKLLLHTWSLSVEWQFYLLWPLALLAAEKLRQGRVRVAALMAVVIAASVAYSIYLSGSRPSDAFFSPATRAWEFLAGAVVAIRGKRPSHGLERWRGGAEAAGLLLVIGSVLAFDSSSPWPSWRAAVPAVGTMLVLIAAQQTSPWTGNAVVQQIGTWSYSLYLWHWPLAAWLTHRNLQHDATAVLSALLSTLLLGALSYYVLERWARRALDKLEIASGSLRLALATTGGLALAALVIVLHGVPSRLPDDIRAIEAEMMNFNPRRDECRAKRNGLPPGCIYGEGPLRAVVIGDSHASSVVTAVHAALGDTPGSILELSHFGCPVAAGVRRQGYNCGGFNAYVLEKAKDLPAGIPVIIVTRLSNYAFGSNEAGRPAGSPLVDFGEKYSTPEPDFLKQFADRTIESVCAIAARRPVYLVRPIPEMPGHVPKLAAIQRDNRELSVKLDHYLDRHRVAFDIQSRASVQCGARILDPLPYFCDREICLGTEKRRPLYIDDDHLSEFGNRRLIPMFATVFAPIEKRATSH